MSRTGCFEDNAVMERFLWSLKHEWTNHENYLNPADARPSGFRYIETFHHSERLHQTLEYLAPNHFEAVKAPVQAA